MKLEIINPLTLPAPRGYAHATLANIENILAAAGAKYEQVVKFGVYVLQGQDPQIGFRAFQENWGRSQHVPTISVLFVAGFARPDWLVEIDAIAVLPE